MLSRERKPLPDCRNMTVTLVRADNETVILETPLFFRAAEESCAGRRASGKIVINMLKLMDGGGADRA